jgi:hypothetical protein
MRQQMEVTMGSKEGDFTIKLVLKKGDMKALIKTMPSPNS